jgi:hypothetical protein
MDRKSKWQKLEKRSREVEDRLRVRGPFTSSAGYNKDLEEISKAGDEAAPVPATAVSAR